MKTRQEIEQEIIKLQKQLKTYVLENVVDVNIRVNTIKEVLGKNKLQFMHNENYRYFLISGLNDKVRQVYRYDSLDDMLVVLNEIELGIDQLLKFLEFINELEDYKKDNFADSSYKIECGKLSFEFVGYRNDYRVIVEGALKLNEDSTVDLTLVTMYLIRTTLLEESSVVLNGINFKVTNELSTSSYDSILGQSIFTAEFKDVNSKTLIDRVCDVLKATEKDNFIVNLLANFN